MLVTVMAPVYKWALLVGSFCREAARVLSGATLRSLLWVQVSRQALAPYAILPSIGPSMCKTHSPLPS